MAKRNIEVKEKELIDRLNNRYHIGVDTAAGKDRTSVVRWDNHGPIQFEEQGDEEKKPYVQPNVHVDNNAWKNDYFSGKTVEPMTVSLAPRDGDGSIIDGVDEWEDKEEDRRASRSLGDRAKSLPLGKSVEIEVERLMKNKVHLLALKKCLDGLKEAECTQLRTSYEEVNHPQHYNNYDVEVIDMMERIFGKEETAIFCKLNAFKYRMRAGTKPNQSMEKDLKKEKWYLDKKNELEQK